MDKFIEIRGARENNLKNINLKIPRDQLVVFTGVSGSGKSTLAFDTIFAEGQRRYVESLSSYARQFLGQMQKPDVDSIDGLSPAISIDQKTTSHNPRSTVGTVTEIYDYLRLLFARVGTPYCTKCNVPIEKQTIDQIAEKVLQNKTGAKLLIKAPVVRGEKGMHQKVLESLQKSGYVRVEIDGIIYAFDEEIKLDKNIKHSISVVVDRLLLEADIQKRLTDSLETAIKLTDGRVVVEVDGKDTFFNTNYTCDVCGESVEEISPRIFSFNNPFGACQSCSGLGFKMEIDPAKVMKADKSINAGGLAVMGFGDGAMATMIYEGMAKRYQFSLDTPIKDLPKDILNKLLYGIGSDPEFEVHYTGKFEGIYKCKFEGIIPMLERRYRETTSQFMKDEYQKLMTESACDTCNGRRLNKQALSVKIAQKSIYDVCEMPIDEVKDFFEKTNFEGEKAKIAESILKEIYARLSFLLNVGLSYLNLNRTAGTLSGGEAQRIRLATQIGSGLAGVLYILDEPSIGLHQRDNERLIKTLKTLRDLGNTLIVVEHDEETIMAADHIVDVGPKAGVHGGKIVAQGTLEDIKNEQKSLTGQYLCGIRQIKVPQKRRNLNNEWLEVIGACQNNLKNINVKIPSKVLTCITGVSGGGKSSLVNEIIEPALANFLNGARRKVGNCKEVKGMDYFDKVIAIDQSPIGRTPRSNPATYTGVWTPIRELFSATIDAKERGYAPGRFSFNVSGGRCEACGGDGLKKIEMYFLPDVYITCEHCKGLRYNRETLEVKYKGKNINDVLEMTVEEALKFFENIPAIQNKIQTLYDVGLRYIKMGQPATTLSGGEAQRVKLATELSKRSTGKTFYVLDEPTTGLHFYDTEKLVHILQRLTDSGNTVLVIEHNLDVIKMADYVIDLGPEGGRGGGTVVATGTPEEIAENKNSHTGRFLKKILQNKK